MNTLAEHSVNRSLAHRIFVLLVILLAATAPIAGYVVRSSGSGETTVITQVLLRALGS